MAIGRSFPPQTPYDMRLKMKRIVAVLCALVLVTGWTMSAHAILIDRGGGLIYDSGLNITWLQDANFAKTSGFHPTGDMSWNEANVYINFLNTNIFFTYNDWRLPNILPINGISYDNNFSEDGSTDNGFNITSPNSELSYLYYVSLGNLAAQSTNAGPFINIEGAPYWSGNEYPVGSGVAWNFHFGAGLQNALGGIYYPWAVRDGDVVSVPEPSTLLLLGFGTLWIVFKRKKIAFS